MSKNTRAKSQLYSLKASVERLFINVFLIYYTIVIKVQISFQEIHVTTKRMQI